MRVVVSIINYRTGEMTRAAAQSVLDDFGALDGRMIIVDNASGDGSADDLEAWVNTAKDPRLQLIRSPNNTGFSGGHNQAFAAEPDADYYLLLNSDALLRPGFFDALLATAKAQPKAGLIAPQLEWDDGKVQESCFRFASAGSEMIRAAATGAVSRLLKHRQTGLPMPPDPAKIEWASFACILLNGEMVRAIGPMDDGYFLYFEDAEYALRARRAGWGVLYDPAARAVHFRGGSGPVKANQSAKKRLPSYFWRSRTRFLRQAYGPFGPVCANLAWIAGRGVAHLRRLIGRTPPPAHEKEWRDVWTGFFAPLRPDTEPRK